MAVAAERRGMGAEGGRDGAAITRHGRRALWLLALWLVLTEGSTKHPVLALAIIAGATAVAGVMGLAAGWRLRPLGVLRFLPFFIRISVAGGIDVALRAFRRRAPLDPELVRYRLRLGADTPATIFFACVVSLVPGTLCAELEGAEATVHVVDRGQDNRERLQALETRVAALFGQALPEGGP